MIICFETFGIFQILKVKVFKFKAIDYVKPFDCRFCMHFWIGTILALASLDAQLFILNIVISQFYEKINQ